MLLNLYLLQPRSRVVRQGSARRRRGMRVIQKEQLMRIKDQRWGRQRPCPRTPANQPDQTGRSAPATLSLAGYSPRGGRESDTTEQLSTAHLLRTQTVPSLLACSLSCPFPSIKADLNFHLLDSVTWRQGNTISAPGLFFFCQLCSKITSRNEG